jgi:hypothetical protein
LSAIPTDWQRWGGDTRVRLGLFGFAAVVAVYLGFIGIEVRAAETFIKQGGYYFMLLTVVWWAISLGRLGADERRADPGKNRWATAEKWAVAVVIMLLLVATLGLESLRSKVLYDEYVLQSTAYNMHHFREVATMVRGYDFLGTFVSTDNYLDKRPYFYPFLISLAHDLSGYRTLNAYLVNVMLLPVGLILTYVMGRRWQGRKGGMVAMGLLGTLPLFTQNATGSGMEMTNIVMLLLAVHTGTLFLHRPTEKSLSAFVLTTVLLAQCRYESAIFVAPAALVVLVGWWRSRQIVLSVASLATPLLLVPVALHNKVLSETPILWEMKENQSSRFALEYGADNARGVFEFLFDGGAHLANSVLLSVLGLAGLVVCAVWWGRNFKRLRTMDAAAVVWTLFAIGILANLVLVLFYYWSRFTDPMASRFSLPLYLLMVFASVVLIRWLDRRVPASLATLGLILVGFLGFGVPKQAYHFYSRMGVDEIEWEHRFVASLPPAKRIMVTNKSTLPWLLEKTPSILIDRARLVSDRLAHQLAEPTFDEILVSQSLRPTTAQGHHQLVPEEALPDEFVLQTLVERRFGTKIARISRLVEITPPPDETPEESAP